MPEQRIEQPELLRIERPPPRDRRVIDAAPVPEVGWTPAEATEQILAGLADRLAGAPVASLALYAD
jgi:hypothetical protein